MASQIPCSPPMTLARRSRGASSSSGELPEDVLFLVLQLLPAKDICRLRAVCRSWRALTSGKAFIREHAGRHREPLFLAKFRGDDAHAHFVDLSGNEVKRIAIIAGATAAADGGGLMPLRMRLNQATCLATKLDACRTLCLATGCSRQVPPDLVALPVIMAARLTSFVLGRVASTGEYKLLRIQSTSNFSGVKVLTIKGGADHAQWRERLGHRIPVDAGSGVAVDGVVYFLKWTVNLIIGNTSVPLDDDDDEDAMPADYILSFDLAREEWRRDLHGPSSTAGNLTSGQMERRRLTLAHLKGSLVLAHHPRSPSVLDLWFLRDFESSLWVKQYCIPTDSVSSSFEAMYHLIPLLVLDDGRLVIHLAPAGLLFICDPETNTFTQVDIRQLDSIAVYTGSLLSLQEGDMV